MIVEAAALGLGMGLVVDLIAQYIRNPVSMEYASLEELGVVAFIGMLVSTIVYQLTNTL